MKRVRTRIGHKAKLLCPVCREVKAAYQNDDVDTVYLECGHPRTPYLLPSNGIGLEDIASNTMEAARLFPFVHDDVVNKKERRREV